MSLEADIARTVEAAVERALATHARPIQREALKVREAAEAIGVSDDTMRNLIADGHVPAVRCGDNGHLLVPLAGLRAWLNQDAAA